MGHKITRDFLVRGLGELPIKVIGRLTQAT